MLLSAFVDEALSQVLAGVKSAQAKGKGIKADVGPAGQHETIEFDVPLFDKDGNLTVGGTPGLMGSADGMSRIKFKVSVWWPEEG